MRMLEILIGELAEEEGWLVEFQCEGWLGIVQTGTATTRIFGYHFELNPSAAAMICGDKVATFKVLQRFGIPAVRHDLFLKPGFYGSGTAGKGIWPGLSETLAEFRGQAVLKPVSGTGGTGVVRIKNQMELETAAHELFSRNYALALSPYLPIEAEYRVVMLDESPRLIYRKCRQEVVGDGESSLLELAVRQCRLAEKKWSPNSIGRDQDPLFVPASGVSHALGFKHNLGLGAQAEAVADSGLEARLAQLARGAVKALGMRFCSVDIVAHEGEFSVLEVNAGVMMESYARQSEETRARAKAIYREVLRELLQLRESLKGTDSANSELAARSC